MNIALRRSRKGPSRFERHARTVGIVVAALLLGLTVVEMAATTIRGGSIHKLPGVPSQGGLH